MRRTTILLAALSLTTMASAAPVGTPNQLPVTTNPTFPGKLPPGITLPPSPTAKTPPLPLGTPVEIKSGRVDEVLAKIQTNLYKGDGADEAAEEQSLGRNLNMFKNGQSALRPVGFVRTGTTTYALAQIEIGPTAAITKIRAGRTYGPITVSKIEDDGVEYSIGNKKFFAQIAFVPVDAPKPPTSREDTAPAPSSTSVK